MLHLTWSVTAYTTDGTLTQNGDPLRTNVGNGWGDSPRTALANMLGELDRSAQRAMDSATSQTEAVIRVRGEIEALDAA